MSQIQEKIKLVPKEYDSIIVYTFYRGGLTAPIPHLDSLNRRSHDRDAFLICFKNDSTFAICIAQYDSGVGISNRILIQEEPEVAKLRKSWSKVEKEHFAPFIYKHTEDGKTRYDTLNALHPVYGNLTFKSPNFYKNEDFFPIVTEKTAWDFENINYNYNSLLNLFTVYTILTKLYGSLKGQFIYSQ